MRELVTLELKTDQGIEGVGITFFGAAISRALLAAVEDLAALAKGENPLNIESVMAKLRTAAGNSGPGGILDIWWKPHRKVRHLHDLDPLHRVSRHLANHEQWRNMDQRLEHRARTRRHQPHAHCRSDLPRRSRLGNSQRRA